MILGRATLGTLKAVLGSIYARASASTPTTTDATSLQTSGFASVGLSVNGLTDTGVTVSRFSSSGVTVSGLESV